MMGWKYDGNVFYASNAMLHMPYDHAMPYDANAYASYEAHEAYEREAYERERERDETYEG